MLATHFRFAMSAAFICAWTSAAWAEEAVFVPTFQLPPVELLVTSSNERPLNHLVDKWLEKATLKPWLVMDQPPEESEMALRPPNIKGVRDVMTQTLRWVQGIEGGSDLRGGSDFRVQFLHSFVETMPTWAVVAVAERVAHEHDGFSGEKMGGMIGLQLNLLGMPTLALEPGEQQLVLRVMPLGANLERASYGLDPFRQTEAPGSGIVPRFTVEAEAAKQRKGFRHGVRLLVQVQTFKPTQYRMIAEVFLSYEIMLGAGKIDKTLIVPRCLIDLSTNDPDFAAGLDNPDRFQVGNRLARCTLSTEFVFGN